MVVFDLRATSGAEAAYPSGAPVFTPDFSEVRVTWFLVLCVCFIDRCLAFCPLFFLCSLSFFNLRILITHLVSSISFLTTYACSLTLLDIWKKTCYYINGICGESREYKIFTILSVTFQYYLSLNSILSVTFQYYLSLFNIICHFSILSVTFQYYLSLNSILSVTKFNSICHFSILSVTKFNIICHFSILSVTKFNIICHLSILSVTFQYYLSLNSILSVTFQYYLSLNSILSVTFQYYLSLFNITCHLIQYWNNGDIYIKKTEIMETLMLKRLK